MFLKPGAKNVNEIEVVAPTGFEPVFQSATRFRSDRTELGEVD